MNTESNQPAFANSGIQGSDKFVYEPGLTKREYFACLAMQGLCACKVSDPKFLAGAAVEYADALIEQLNVGNV